MSPQDEADKQYLLGLYNRRVAAGARNHFSEFVPFDEEVGTAEFFCTCGHPDCDEIIVMMLDEYDFVRESPHRFIVAPGHATEADEVLRRHDAYDVVEIKDEYRSEYPLTREEEEPVRAA